MSPNLNKYAPNKVRLSKSSALIINDSVARIFQYETDHLDGVLYVDRMDIGDELEPYDF